MTATVPPHRPRKCSASRPLRLLAKPRALVVELAITRSLRLTPVAFWKHRAHNYPTPAWSSWHDFMPGSPPTLHIKGRIIFPAPDYSAVLVPRVPQGNNPAIYLFDLVITKPSDSNEDERGHFEEEVRYSEATSEPYTGVVNFPEEISAPVNPVH